MIMVNAAMKSDSLIFCPLKSGLPSELKAMSHIDRLWKKPREIPPTLFVHLSALLPQSHTMLQDSGWFLGNHFQILEENRVKLSMQLHQMMSLQDSESTSKDGRYIHKLGYCCQNYNKRKLG
jgi:hypothetical protein